MVNVSFFVCLYTFYIQLVMINHLSACGEYEPYHFVDTEQARQKRCRNIQTVLASYEERVFILIVCLCCEKEVCRVYC